MEEEQVPSEFKKIIVDMTRDILVSFPEQEANLQKDGYKTMRLTDNEYILIEDGNLS